VNSPLGASKVANTTPKLSWRAPARCWLLRLSISTSCHGHILSQQRHGPYHRCLCEKRRVTFPHQIHGKHLAEVFLQEDHQRASGDFSLFKGTSTTPSGCPHCSSLFLLLYQGSVPASCSKISLSWQFPIAQ